ncbi:MAG TPA: AbrB/MazE/SpoVT family DNA-binding domain-containing protein [Desulfobacterales bacterium]|nr:AbrB/MazE/SpoVT family DNA-binding domain-containing protein [Desulfobacterales bacterium]
MLAKVTSKNQITIPKQIMDEIGRPDYFEVQCENGLVLLKPVRTYDTDLARIRAKMRSLGLTERTVAEAVAWARRKA